MGNVDMNERAEIQELVRRIASGRAAEQQLIELCLYSKPKEQEVLAHLLGEKRSPLAPPDEPKVKTEDGPVEPTE